MATQLRQSDRLASFVTPKGEDEFFLLEYDASESLSELFEYNIKAASETENADIQSIIGENCYIKMRLKNGKLRIFHGVLIDAQWLGKDNDLHIYQFSLRPWLWLLSRRSDCRIFKDKSVIEILEVIFNKEAKSKFQNCTSNTFPKLEYCVQYRETDLDFASRLMEKYGIYYFFKHSEAEHNMILAYSRSAHEPIQAAAESWFDGNANAYPYMAMAESRRPIEHIGDWSTLRRLRTGKIELKDYDFKKSDTDLTSRAEEGFPRTKSYESYDYPGLYLDREEGKKFAQVRAQAEQARDDRRFANGQAPSLYPGALMTLGDHPTTTENAQYLVVGAKHSFTGQGYRSTPGVDTTVYSGSYELQKKDRPFRAPIRTPGPTVLGPHTAKVVGKENDCSDREGDIDVDEYGRIWLRFHWDREDKSTSCRVRVAQLWSGKKWGGQIIPRIGQEVVVEFLEGNPDRPLVTGTVVNDQHMPPYDLPGNKTQSGLKSESTKGKGKSGAFNEIKFEDLTGKEVFSMQAEKDHKVLVYNIETRDIGERYDGGGFSRETTLHKGSDKLDVQSGKLDVTAATEIVMKVGDSVIRMLPASIEISSPTITIKSTLKTDVLSDAIVTIKGGMVLIN